MASVGRIFGSIRILMDENRKRGHVLLWREIPDKAETFYIPLLDSFEDEICRLVSKSRNVPSLLLEYLLGKNDFYKIIKYNKKVTIQGYNLHETLNMPSNSINAQNRVSRLKFPTRIIEVRRQGNNKTIITFDNGWQISFRIHNASSKAEPSLKFDVRLEGVPPSLYSHNESW